MIRTGKIPSLSIAKIPDPRPGIHKIFKPNNQRDATATSSHLKDRQLLATDETPQSLINKSKSKDDPDLRRDGQTGCKSNDIRQLSASVESDRLFIKSLNCFDSKFK